MSSPQTLKHFADDSSLLVKTVDEAALEFTIGSKHWTRQAGFEQLSKRVQEDVGKGGWGGVSKVYIGDRRDGKSYAEKTLKMQNYSVSREVANAAIFGELGIGPRLYEIETGGGRTRYVMDIAPTDAKKFERAAFDGQAIKQVLDGPYRVDGDLLVGKLRGRHEDAGMTKESFDMLVKHDRQQLC